MVVWLQWRGPEPEDSEQRRVTGRASMEDRAPNWRLGFWILNGLIEHSRRVERSDALISPASAGVGFGSNVPRPALG